MKRRQTALSMLERKVCTEGRSWSLQYEHFLHLREAASKRLEKVDQAHKANVRHSCSVFDWSFFVSMVRFISQIDQVGPLHHGCLYNSCTVIRRASRVVSILCIKSLLSCVTCVTRPYLSVAIVRRHIIEQIYVDGARPVRLI